jgi:hypothetical protein
MLIDPASGQVVAVNELVRVAWFVPTCPLIVPVVRVTAALASTAKSCDWRGERLSGAEQGVPSECRQVGAGHGDRGGRRGDDEWALARWPHAGVPHSGESDSATARPIGRVSEYADGPQPCNRL